MEDIEYEGEKKAKPHFQSKIYIQRVMDIVEYAGCSGNADEFAIYFEKAVKFM